MGLGLGLGLGRLGLNMKVKVQGEYAAGSSCLRTMTTIRVKCNNKLGVDMGAFYFLLLTTLTLRHVVTHITIEGIHSNCGMWLA
jgi:hypothetical protein